MCARRRQSSSFYDCHYFFRFPIAFACIVLRLGVAFVRDNAIILCVQSSGNRCQNYYARRNSPKPIRRDETTKPRRHRDGQPKYAAHVIMRTYPTRTGGTSVVESDTIDRIFFSGSRQK